MPETTAEFIRRVGVRVDPVADPAAVLVVGDARFTVLTERLVRLEWAPGQQFEDRGSYAFPVRRGPVPTFTVHEQGETTMVDTGALLLRYRPDGQPFSADNLSIEVRAVPETVWTPGQRDRLNLGGARRTVDNCRGGASLEPGLVSRSGWAVHDDWPSMLFDDAGWAVSRPELDHRDLYFFGYGHDYPAAVQDYTRFGGSVPLVPRWMLGSWWSRYWAYRDQDLRALVEEFSARGLPLDVLVIDMDWHLTDSWTGYTWNRELFADPAGFLRWLHERGLHDTLNLHPALGVQPFEAAYPDFAQAMQVTDGSAVPFHVDDPEFMRNYFELLHHPLEDEGVDFWWIDWQQGRTFEGSRVDPLPWLNHLHFTDLGRHPGTRPITFSRWGGLGSHRYPIGFSGDSFARWAALQFQPRYTAAGANVGYGWWSHDIGGHVGPDDPELYVRWVQFGAYSPILRLHSNQDPLSDRRPWAFGEEVLQAARSAFEQRYQLMPYLYTAARTAADTGLAPIRPLSWLDPSADSAYASRFSYLLGADLLVAPVLTPASAETGLAEVDVWLPAGEWLERTTLERFTGPTWVRQFADLERIPQFVRLGTVLPLADVALTTSAQPDRLTLSVFGGADGSTRVYSDDGSSLAFERGEYSWTTASVQTPSDRECEVRTDGPVAAIRFEGAAAAEVTVDGVTWTDWRQDGSATVVELDGRSGAVVRLSAPDRLFTFGDELNAALRDADVRRLIGTTPLAQLDPEHPGRAAAIARLGGPAISVQEHTAPDEAANVLGRLIVGKGAGQAVRVSGEWTLQRGATSERFPVEPIDVPDGGLVLEAPCNWDDSRTPTRWSVAVTAEWQADWGPVTVEHRFDSQVLSPDITSWAVALVDPGITEPGVRDWRLYEVDPFDLDFSELTQVYEVPNQWGPVPLDDVLVHARTRLTATENCQVSLEYFNSSPELEIRLDGRPVEADVTGAGPCRHYDLAPTPRRTASFELTAGEHELWLRCPKSSELYWHEWTLSARVLDAATGQLRLDVGSDASRLIARF